MALPLHLQNQAFAPLRLDQFLQPPGSSNNGGHDDAPMEQPPHSAFGEQQQQAPVHFEQQNQNPGQLYEEFLALQQKQTTVQQEVTSKKKAKAKEIEDDMLRKRQKMVKCGNRYFVLKETAEKAAYTSAFLAKGFLDFNRKRKGRPIADEEGKEFAQYLEEKRTTGDKKVKLTNTTKRPSEFYF